MLLWELQQKRNSGFGQNPSFCMLPNGINLQCFHAVCTYFLVTSWLAVSLSPSNSQLVPWTKRRFSWKKTSKGLNRIIRRVAIIVQPMECLGPIAPVAAYFGQRIYLPISASKDELGQSNAATSSCKWSTWPAMWSQRTLFMLLAHVGGLQDTVSENCFKQLHAVHDLLNGHWVSSS